MEKILIFFYACGAASFLNVTLQGESNDATLKNNKKLPLFLQVGHLSAGDLH